MKIYKCITVVAFLVLLFGSCKQKLSTSEYTVISGKIENTNGGELTIMFRDEFKEFIKINKDGSFSDTLDIKDGHYIIICGNTSTGAYITKGGNVNFTASEKDFINTLTFKGDYADLNNYFVERGKAENYFRSNAKDYYDKDEDTFVKMITNDKKQLENKLNALDNVPADIKEKELRHLAYKNLEYKYMYQAFYHKRSPGNENYKASKGFMKAINEIPTDKPEDYKYSAAYYYLMTYVILGNRTNQEYEKNKEAGYLEAFNNAALTIESEDLRNLLLYDNIIGKLQRVPNKKEFYENFMNISTNDTHKALITKRYNELSFLNPGNPSPKFTDYENYNGGTTSLEDFKGKYVYIDIWATWCGPCKYEIPFLQKIEKQYHDKNIAFISISVDKKADYQAWKNMIKNKQMSGIQLFADRAFESEFIKSYKISAIPQFILLDPNGNIVKSQAPRPSDDKLIDLFKELGI